MTNAQLRFAVFAAAAFLFSLGCLVAAWIDNNHASRQATTQGTITQIHNGKGTTWEYTFRVDGTLFRDSDGTCQTPLSEIGCQVGAPVLVYYDLQSHASSLEDYRDAHSHNLRLSLYAAGAGLACLIILLLLRLNEGPPDPNLDESSAVPPENTGIPDNYHITPDN